jgi:hypothetical protein
VQQCNQTTPAKNKKESHSESKRIKKEKKKRIKIEKERKKGYQWRNESRQGTCSASVQSSGVGNKTYTNPFLPVTCE